MNILPEDHPVLETNNLYLREDNPQLRKKAVERLSEEELKLFYGLSSKEELEKFHEDIEQGLKTSRITFKVWYLISKRDKKVIGSCGYHTWYMRHHRAEIGYAMIQEGSKRKGLMTEAFTPVIEHGFNEMNLNRIEAFIGPGNIPSIKLVDRFNFRREGEFRSHYLKDGHYLNSIIFSLLKKEYRPPTKAL